VPFYVYILESKIDFSLYTGQTNDLPTRLIKHNRGLVKSTKPKRPYELVYFETFPTRAEAMWREWELKKKWNTGRKKKLIQSFSKSKIKGILAGTARIESG
jgi:putative endonuclease